MFNYLKLCTDKLSPRVTNSVAISHAIFLKFSNLKTGKASL